MTDRLFTPLNSLNGSDCGMGKGAPAAPQVDLDQSESPSETPLLFGSMRKQREKNKPTSA
jgi:hypothetical protein